MNQTYFEEYNLEQNPESQAFVSDYELIPEQQKQNIKNYEEQPSQTKESNQIIEMNVKKTNYKNLPKLIGNNFCKYAEHNSKLIPKGVQNLIEKRKKTKQYFTKISDLREVCQTDQVSKKIFKKYIKKQLFIDLVFSSRIQHPLEYVDGVNNYYAASKEPEKMISSQLKQKQL